MNTVLTQISLLILALLVLVLVIYLILIIVNLYRAGKHLKNLIEGLDKIIDNTKPLAGEVNTINSGLSKLPDRLSSTDSYLLKIAKVLNLV